METSVLAWKSLSGPNTRINEELFWFNYEQLNNINPGLNEMIFPFM